MERGRFVLRRQHLARDQLVSAAAGPSAQPVVLHPQPGGAGTHVLEVVESACRKVGEARCLRACLELVEHDGERDVGCEPLFVGAACTLTHRRGFALEVAQCRGQLVDPVLGPPEAELVPLRARRGDPLVGDDDGNSTCGQRLVETDRRGTHSAWAEDELGTEERLGERLAPLVEADRRRVVEDEAFRGFDVDPGVRQSEDGLAGPVGPSADEACEQIRFDPTGVDVETGGRIVHPVVGPGHLPPTGEMTRRHAHVDPRKAAPRGVAFVVDGNLVREAARGLAGRDLVELPVARQQVAVGEEDQVCIGRVVHPDVTPFLTLVGEHLDHGRHTRVREG